MRCQGKRLSYDAPMKRILFATLLCCALPLISVPAFAQSADAITIGTRRVVKSAVLKEDRTVYIQLPESYAKSSGYHRYPVLYVRDGGKFFQSFAGAVQHLSSDATPHVPDMIVVAIPETDRVRDSSSTRSLQGFTGKRDEGFASSGGGDNFLRFLDAGAGAVHRQGVQHLLISHLLRLFVHRAERIDAFLDKEPLFDAFLMIDPSWWWDDYVMEKRAAAELASRKFERAQLFIAASGEPYPEKYFIKARDVEALAEILRKTNPAGLEWKFERYEDESHYSMALRSLHDGLSYFFRGYQPTLRELYVEPGETQGSLPGTLREAGRALRVARRLAVVLRGAVPERLQRA